MTKLTTILNRQQGFLHRLPPDLTSATSTWIYSTYGIKLRANGSYDTPIPRETAIAIHQDAAVPDSVVAVPVWQPDYASPARAPDAIDKIGVELEGGWHERPSDRRVWLDGSVNSSLAAYTGEVHTDPVNAITDVMSQIVRHYPNRVNWSCGMHVHYSFRSKGIYSAFICEEFTKWLVDGLKSWGERAHIRNSDFYERLAGDNSYCRTTYTCKDALRQIHDREKSPSRYRMVNYCYMLHGTMEIRVLPMFIQCQTAAAAVRELTRLVGLWAEANVPHPREQRLVATTLEPEAEATTEEGE